MKICKKCNTEKSFDEMVKNKNCKDGYEPRCKLCNNQYIKNYRNIFNKTKRVKVDTSKTKKLYYEANKEKINANGKKWRDANKEELKKLRRTYLINKKKTDILFRLKENIKNNIRQSFSVRKFRKVSKTANILGCTYEEFKQHLESNFEPWMRWDNYGNWNGIPTEINTAWDIDHIIPLDTAKSIEDITRLNHYSNLQPLCSYTNRWVKHKNHLK